jgi:Arc/MetJ family transcription regulator
MRTNIEIDDKLIKRARKLSKLKTKKDIVQVALENLIKTLNRKSLIELKGKINWEGDLSKMRRH